MRRKALGLDSPVVPTNGALKAMNGVKGTPAANGNGLATNGTNGVNGAH